MKTIHASRSRRSPAYDCSHTANLNQWVPVFSEVGEAAAVAQHSRPRSRSHEGWAGTAAAPEREAGRAGMVDATHKQIETVVSPEGCNMGPWASTPAGRQVGSQAASTN